MAQVCFMKLEELKIYQLAMDLGEDVWNIVVKWDYFAKDTIGKQLVKSADSVSANISEGYGRYYFKDSKVFFYFARGSLYETKTWLKKANERKLIDDQIYSELESRYTKLGVKLNNFIKFIGKTNLDN